MDQEGNPALDRPQRDGGLDKRTLGDKTGRVLVLGNPLLVTIDAPVRVAEGVADALALAARFTGPAVASMGDAGMNATGFAQWLASTVEGVIIHADNDTAGQKAASRLCGGIRIHGGTARAVLPPDGKDAGVVSSMNPFDALTDNWPSYAGHAGPDERLAPLGSPAPSRPDDGGRASMTSHNGHQHISAFEGTELTPGRRVPSTSGPNGAGRRHRGRQSDHRGPPARPGGPGNVAARSRKRTHQFPPSGGHGADRTFAAPSTR